MNTQRICPGPDELRQFAVGRLPEAAAEAVESHLHSCPRCADAAELSSGDDALGEALRAGTPTPHAADTPEVVDLVGRLKSLYVDPTREQPTPPGGSVPPVIGRYHVRRKLGEGGMGAVYKAEDPKLDRMVAVKLPRFEGSPERQFQARQRFLREARAAARVRHPHVCPIYDVGEQDGRPYVVMAYVEGRSLAEDLVERGRYEDVREAVELVRQVAGALQAVHAHGIVHRDLKPGNILLDRDGGPLLTDFGLARLDDEADRLTSEGVLMGTPAYLAPEQVNPELGAFGPRGDVYSLGVVLHELLTGHRPFCGSMAQLLNQVGHHDAPPVGQSRPELDLLLQAVVMKALARRPEERYADAASFAEALGHWQSGDRAAAPKVDATLSAPLPAAVVRKRRPWVLWIAGVAACVGLAVAVGSAVLRRSGGVTDGGSPNHAAATAPQSALAGTLDLRVYRPGGTQGVRLTAPGALPLRPGDGIRVEVTLSRPAYPYVVLIDAAGQAAPAYPWEKGDWGRRPANEELRTQLSLPIEEPAGGGVGGYTVEPGLTGMETMILLTRDEPLPAAFDLRGLLTGLPQQKEQELRAAAWFEDGRPVPRDDERGISLFDVRRVEDPVLQTQAILRERLGPHFRYIGAVSYAVQGQ
jgi:predicted Ser/Thr protein kinase